MKFPDKFATLFSSLRRGLPPGTMISEVCQRFAQLALLENMKIQVYY